MQGNKQHKRKVKTMSDVISKMGVQHNKVNGTIITTEFPLPDPEGVDAIFIRVILIYSRKMQYLYIDKATATIIRDKLTDFINSPDTEPLKER